MDKIKSLECIRYKKGLVACCHLIIASISKATGEHIPYFCIIKNKQIINPSGKRKCKRYEKPRITKGMLGEIDIKNEVVCLECLRNKVTTTFLKPILPLCERL